MLFCLRNKTAVKRAFSLSLITGSFDRAVAVDRVNTQTNDLLLKIDDIAESILTHGYSPNHNYSGYKKISEITESTQESDGIKAIEDILNSFRITISLHSELLNLSADANDEGTNALMSDYIRAQEKLVWLCSAFLKK